QSGDGPSLSGGEVSRPANRCEGNRTAALGRRIEHALPAGRDVPCGQRRTIREADAAAEVKGVSQPVRGDVPALGERGLNLRIRCKTGESFEDVRHRAAGRHVDGEGRVERAGIGVVPGVDDGPAIRAAAISARDRQQYSEY